MNFEAGDTFEVVVARMQKFIVTVTESETNTTNPTNLSHKLEIKKNTSDSDANHILLPKDGLIVDQTLQDQSKRTIYFTKGTQLDYKLDSLPHNYEIKAWRKGSSTSMPDDFYDNPNDDVERVGKTHVQNIAYPHDPNSNYTPVNFNAWITEKGHLVKIYLQDFAQDGSNDVLATDTDDGLPKV